MNIRAYSGKDASSVRKMLESLIEYADSILPAGLKKFEELEDREKALAHAIGLSGKKNWKTFVCEAEGKPVGFITGGVEKELRGYRLSKYGNVEIFYVEEAFRGRGIGKKLMLAMLDWFRQRGCDAARVDTWSANCKVREVYQKMGFSEIAVMHVRELEPGGEMKT